MPPRTETSSRSRTPLESRSAGPTAIYDRLRLDQRFEGSLGAVKRLCLLLLLRKAKGVSADDVAIPVDTVAGEIAQVDFGYVGQLYDPDEGRMRKAWIFVMVLAFSRLMVVRIVFDQKIETQAAALHQANPADHRPRAAAADRRGAARPLRDYPLPLRMWTKFAT